MSPASHEGNFTGKRQWVILSHDFAISQVKQERLSLSLPNINPADIFIDLRSALKTVINKYGVPAILMPSEETIEAIDSEYKHRQDVAKINKDKAESQFSEFTSATEPVPQNEISDLASDDFSKTEESPVDVNSLVEDEDDLFNPKNAFQNKTIKKIIFKKANRINI
jgi:predicted metal-binding protein